MRGSLQTQRGPSSLLQGVLLKAQGWRRLGGTRGWPREGPATRKIAGPVQALTELRGTVVFNHGETDMGDKGSKDKGKREQQKKAKLSPKEKRQLKKEKKNK